MLWSVREFAKHYGIGRNTFYKMLREDKILDYYNKPYRETMKYFEVEEVEISSWMWTDVTRINEDGVEFLCSWLKRKGYDV